MLLNLKNIFNNTIIKVLQFEFYENLRNKWVFYYSGLFFILTYLIIRFGGAQPLQASGSLLSLVILLVPIFSLIFGSVSFIETLGFMELMAAQPVKRSSIYIGKCLGLSISLSMSFLLGMGLAIILSLSHSDKGLGTIIMLLVLGVMLSFVFVSFAFLLANLSNKKEIVLGLVLTIWFYFFILHDLIMFGVVVSFGDYPLEWLILTMSALNPIDLSRVIITLHMDLSSLMGASGALIYNFFGGAKGIVLGMSMLCLWFTAPLLIGIKIFNKRNL
ncbi:MAG: ABC transporter permease subunit [Bdellovibrionales bacterium]|nr:ABC transporter permease subunit [Bdellovibrionales bacterium]